MVPAEQLAVHGRYVDAVMHASRYRLPVSSSDCLMVLYPGVWRWATLRMFSVTGGQLSLAFKPQNANVREMQESFARHHLDRALKSGGVSISSVVMRSMSESRARRVAARGVSR